MSQTHPCQDERDFVRWLQARCRKTARAGETQPQSALMPGTGCRVEIPIGDDMGGLAIGGDQILVTADMLLDGIHFDLAEHSPAAIGRKAAACSLSDCAAMAVCPRGAIVSLALPDRFSVDDAKAIMEGVIDMCGRFDCVLMGGDTTRWKHPLVVDVAMVACPYPGIGPVRRDGAQAGDRILTTGRLGGSIRGHHLSFTPRVHEAHRIAAALGENLHAMMDISDGLAIDLDRMLEASGKGAILDRDAVLAVASDAANEISRNDEDLIRHVLSDGEDYELLLTAKLTDEEAESLGLIAVGTIDEGEGMRLRDSQGHETKIEPVGWQHF
ncbi:MAG: thiamine-monophosphate kinase [Planctomycetes bacterium]|nr:thiamine-monophosphate kinase [Planctomycetota bacterium]